MQMFTTIWHKWLNQPYQLRKVIDTGSGTPLVLLHGIGSSSQVWQHTVPLLSGRIVAFDLLGFGTSPKPDLEYTTDDHARSVIVSLSKLGQKPVVLIGHSMGCLIAVRVARLRPDLVKHLVLYEMPLYDGLPEKWRYSVRTDLYFRFYNKVINFAPTFDNQTAKLAERLAYKIVGFQVTKETWQPFIRSLKNTIITQTTADDIKRLPMPMDVIYGSYDMVVIRGKTRHVFGTDSTLITAHTIRERHMISLKASKFIAKRVQSALN